MHFDNLSAKQFCKNLAVQLSVVVVGAFTMVAGLRLLSR